MKTTSPKLFIVLLIAMLSLGNLSAQSQPDTTAAKLHVVVKHDGIEFVGKIISQDAREVLLETTTIGQVVIPKHEIKQIRELSSGDFTVTGVYMPDEVFATRYFLTTNGLPIKKGESYIQWNPYGPDMQFGVGKNFGIGIMTSWVAVPIIGTAKYTIPLKEKTNLGVGVLLGTGSWSVPEFALALPFASMTFGDRKANFTVSGGYGSVRHPQEEYSPAYNTYTTKKVTESRAMFSVAFMFKVGRKVSFVFDSILVPAGKDETVTGVNYYWDPNTGQPGPPQTYQYKRERPSFALFVPGLRWQVDPQRAFQFGFAGVSAGGETLPVPIPMIQLYRKL
jgi:hypothetical protein